jgi:hypothetical protein
MELRLQIPDDLIKTLQEKIGSNIKATDIARDALTLFNWAVDERAKGRLVLSSDEEGEKMTRLAMPSLDRAAAQKAAIDAQAARDLDAELLELKKARTTHQGQWLTPPPEERTAKLP